MRHKIFGTCSVGLALFLHLFLSGHAQPPSRIVGTIYDESGASLPGTKIIVRDRSRRFIKALEAGLDGRYSVSVKEGEEYQITALMEGFLTQIQSVLQNGDSPTSLDFTMPVDPSSSREVHVLDASYKPPTVLKGSDTIILMLDEIKYHFEGLGELEKSVRLINNSSSPIYLYGYESKVFRGLLEQKDPTSGQWKVVHPLGICGTGYELRELAPNERGRITVKTGSITGPEYIISSPENTVGTFRLVVWYYQDPEQSQKIYQVTSPEFGMTF